MRFDLDQTVDILRRTPGALRSLLAGLPPEWAEGDDGEGSWSPHDIIGHLAHGEANDFIPRIRSILEHGTSRVFVPFDREAMLRDRETTLAERVDAFERRRAESLDTLAGFALSDEDLGREGSHPSFGPVRLDQLLATWAVHDLAHLAQIAEVMARRYKEAVGPWRVYLPALERTSVAE